MSTSVGIPEDPWGGEGEVAGFDGLRLFYRWARPAQPRGIVALVHGLAEHSGRYAWLAGQLTKAGYAVYACDLRGHGRSEGRRGDVKRFSDYGKDLNTFLQEIRKCEPDLPVFLLGHSLGGLLVALKAIENQSGLAGLITSSAVFTLVSPPSKLKLMGANLISRVLPHLRVSNGLRAEQLSSDPQVVAANRADPLIQRKVTLRWAAEFFRNYSFAIERAGTLVLPLLVLQGGADEIAAVAGAKQFFQRAGSKDKTLQVYDGFPHELFNEPPGRREQVMADLVAWLGVHTPR